MDVRCLQDVRSRGEGTRWWCGNDDKTRGVGMLVKEELCENVVEVRKRCNRVMVIGLVFKEVVRVI